MCRVQVETWTLDTDRLRSLSPVDAGCGALGTQNYKRGKIVDPASGCDFIKFPGPLNGKCPA